MKSHHVLPVIDILNGVAVHAVAGQRRRYQPLASPWAATSAAVDVARGLRGRFGFEQLYVADLDAILQQRPNLAQWRALAEVGYSTLWIDSGLGSVEQAERVVAQAALPCSTRWIVGLESLSEPSELTRLSRVLGPEAVFSLDLMQGQLLTPVAAWSSLSPLEVATAAVEAGFGCLIVLDLAQVGAAGGPATLELCQQLKRRFRSLTLCSGGGVRDEEDVAALVSVGCDHVLVATALHR